VYIGAPHGLSVSIANETFGSCVDIYDEVRLDSVRRGGIRLTMSSQVRKPSLDGQSRCSGHPLALHRLTTFA
jgi:hypothetical protein